MPARELLTRAAGEPYPHGAAEDDPTGLRATLLNVIALLSASGVSRPLLYAAGQQGLLKSPDGGTAVVPEWIDEALGRLASGSLLTFSTDDATVTAHRLTMRAAVERQAADAVIDSLPEPWQNRPAARDAKPSGRHPTNRES